MSWAYTACVLTGYDAFTNTTSGAALNGRVAEMGGTWATSGAATDFAFTDVGGERVVRSTVSDSSQRYAILGSSTYANQEVGVSVEVTAGLAEPWVIARYVDPSNFLLAGLQYSVSKWRVAIVVGGATSQIAAVPWTRTYNATHKLRLIVYSTGHLVAQVLDATGNAASAEIRGYHPALATGGALAAGKAGIADENSNSAASSRYYDSFYAGTPAPEPIVIHAGRSIELRHDSALRQSADGTTWGPPPEYVGGRPTIQPSGAANRSTRIAVMAKRNDVESMPDDHISDATKIEVWITPRYLAVPRAD